MKYKSFAQWPQGTFPADNDLTSDTHDTLDQAEGVCKLLRTNGAGGERLIYPRGTWTEPELTPNQIRFKEIYTKNLTEQVNLFPSKYHYTVDSVPMVAGKMIAAIARNGYEKNSRAMQLTCWELGIAFTYKAIKEFWES